ncbi:MAG: hypothetical protein QM749_04585 [Aquabacterium sp.]
MAEREGDTDTWILLDGVITQFEKHAGSARVARGLIAPPPPGRRDASASERVSEQPRCSDCRSLAVVGRPARESMGA